MGDKNKPGSVCKGDDHVSPRLEYTEIGHGKDGKAWEEEHWTCDLCFSKWALRKGNND
jgi:hypothetical protein